MNFRDDTDSTEKILKLIRKDKDTENIELSKSNSQHHVKNNFFSLKQLFFKKQYTIGFDFRKNSVKIVKLELTSDQRHRLLLYKTIPFNWNDFDNEKQIQELKSVIQLEHTSPNAKIWVAIPKGKAEIRYFRISKVPKKQLLKSIYWTFKKITSIEEDKYIFDFEILGEVKEKEIIKKEIIAYAVLKKDLAVVQAIFSRIGLTVTGISIYPFALQNLIKYQYINTRNENICCLYIGMEWSRIDIFFSNGNLAFSRRIRSCTNSMIDEIAKSINQLKSTLDFPEKPFSIAEGNTDFVQSDQARKIFFSLIYNTQDLESNIKEVALDINSKDIFEMFVPALKRLVWQVERTIESFQSNSAESHIGKIYVSGEIVDYKPVIDYIGLNLEHQIEARDFDPFSSNILNTDEISLPESNAEKSGYVPSFGIALSRNFFTPNFIFTHKQKTLFLNSRRLNYSFFILLIIIVVLTFSGFWGQRYFIKKKEIEFTDLQKKFNKIILKNNIYIENNIIDEQIFKIIETRKLAKLYAKRIFGISVLKDVTNLSPPNIRLFKVSFNSGDIHNETKESEAQFFIDIEGIVQGNPSLFETSLTSYVEKMKNKPYLLKSSIKNKMKNTFNNEEVLNFYINLELRLEN